MRVRPSVTPGCGPHGRAHPRGVPYGIFWGALLISLLVLGDRGALAQGTPSEPAGEGALEGTVVRASTTEIVVALGSGQGLRPGAIVELYRIVEVTHPQSGAVLVDRFPIGRVRLEVGAVLSIGRDLSDLTDLPAVGDVVVAWGPRGPVRPTTPTEPTGVAVTREPTWDLDASPPASPSVSAETVAVQPRTWTRLDADHRRAATAAEPDPPRLGNGLQSWVVTPDRVPPGRPLEVWAGIVERERVEAVRLLLRRAGEATYATLPMTPDGDFNWRAGVPAALVEEPGRIEYAVEVVLDDGRVQPIEGTAAAPSEIVIQGERTDAVEQDGRSRVRAVFEYVDFSTGASVDDHFLRFESSYGYAVDFGAISEFTVGVGIIEGSGGFVEALDAGAPATRSAVNYGFAELGLAFSRAVGGRLRVLAGNISPGGDQSMSGVFGGGLGLRFGEADGTHLLLDAALTERIGNQISAEIVIAAVERVPMSGSAVVTNLPVGADYGVSLGYSIGYQVTDWLSLSARTGINARTTEHLGVTGGLGATLDW
jgi:hypothetical protein